MNPAAAGWASVGDRLPDVRMRGGNDAQTTLHVQCAGRPTVLWVGDEAGKIPGAAVDSHALWLGELGAASPDRRGEGEFQWHRWEVAREWLRRVEPGVAWVVDANSRLRARVPGAPTGPALQAAVQEIERNDASISAPVLQVPAVLEPDLCAELIAHFRSERGGGELSRVLVYDPAGPKLELDRSIKQRRECILEDLRLVEAVHSRIAGRVIPEIGRVFQFAVRNRDPFKLLAYPASQGYFRRHRDNDTPDVAHRRFALSINLDAGMYEGGEFRFPEFGVGSTAPGTGTGLVFSCSLLHEVMPVTRGVRHALTTFLT